MQVFTTHHSYILHVCQTKCMGIISNSFASSNYKPGCPGPRAAVISKCSRGWMYGEHFPKSCFSVQTPAHSLFPNEYAFHLCLYFQTLEYLTDSTFPSRPLSFYSCTISKVLGFVTIASLYVSILCVLLNAHTCLSQHSADFHISWFCCFLCFLSMNMARLWITHIHIFSV